MTDSLDAVYNGIFPGFAFEQAFDVDPDSIAEDAQLRIDLRQVGVQNPAPVSVALARPSPTRFVIALTPEQTARFKPGRVHGDLIMVSGGSVTHLQIRLTIEVVASLTGVPT